MGEKQISVKITIVGDGLVGKTCLLTAYTQRQFPIHYIPTIFENCAEEIVVDGVTYNMKLWDTAGQEDYERLRPLSYPETKCFLVCFAINSKASYDNVDSKWAPEVRYHMPHTPILLVGTKGDLRSDPSEEVLQEKDGKKLKRKIKAEAYMECSAKEMVGLDEIFIEAIRIATKRKSAKKHSSPCIIL